MRIILIDDHGDIRVINEIPVAKELGEVEHPVLTAAKQYAFSPCGICGMVAFDDEYDKDIGGCKYCAGK